MSAYYTVPKSYIRPSYLPSSIQYKRKQIDIVYDCINDGAWWTLADISKATKQPIQSVSARLRDLRKLKYGKYTVRRERTSKKGLYVYKLEQ